MKTAAEVEKENHLLSEFRQQRERLGPGLDIDIHASSEKPRDPLSPSAPAPKNMFVNRLINLGFEQNINTSKLKATDMIKRIEQVYDGKPVSKNHEGGKENGSGRNRRGGNAAKIAATFNAMSQKNSPTPVSRARNQPLSKIGHVDRLARQLASQNLPLSHMAVRPAPTNHPASLGMSPFMPIPPAARRQSLSPPAPVLQVTRSPPHV